MCNEIVGFILSVQSVHKTSLCNLVSEMQWWKHPHHFKSPTSLQHEKGLFKKKSRETSQEISAGEHILWHKAASQVLCCATDCATHLRNQHTMAPWVIMRRTWPTSHCFNACSLPTLLTIKCTNSTSFLLYSSQTWKRIVSSVWSKLAFS